MENISFHVLSLKQIASVNSKVWRRSYFAISPDYA